MTFVEEIALSVGNYAPDFELRGVDLQVHHLARYLEKFRAVAVVFLSNQCSYVQGYTERLKQIQAEFKTQGITIIGINANDATQAAGDSFDNMKIFAAQQQLNFPYLWDSTQDVTRSFGVQKTPTVFLIDKTSVVRYQGAIDDHPQKPADAQSHYLREAMAALVSGNVIQLTSTEGVGTPIKAR